MKQRIESIDVIRGISIIGILFMNILGFHYHEVYTVPFDYYQDHLSRLLYKLNMLVVHNSFYPIFAFLFGIGLAIMFSNLKKKGLSPAVVLYRRIIFMLLFGLIHGLLLFDGDILHTYALLAVVAIPFLFIRKGWSLGVGLCLFALNVLALVSTQLAGSHVQTAAGQGSREGDITASVADHDLMSVIVWNARNFITEHFPRFIEWYLANFIMMLPFILLGMWFYRFDGINKTKRHAKVAAVVGAISLMLGILIKWSGVSDYHDYSISQYLYVGGSLMAAAYMIGIILLAESYGFARCFNPFKAVGKLAFSNYILQSVTMVIIFYICGLYNTLSLLNLMLVAVGISIVQVICSNLYLRRYKTGPLEYVWRRLTYWR